MAEEGNPELVAEQLRHAIDLLRGEIQALRVELQHERDLSGQRLAALEKAAADHEDRLRTVQEGVTSFKVWSGLANGGAGLMSLVALFRTMGMG